jgi:putative sterol carrier protein
MSGNNRAQISALLGQMEEMWGHLETLFAIVDANDGWGQKHGADWTFADLPYHLAYCNRDMVGRGIELGTDLPEAEQDFIGSMPELGAWNARKFAERSPEYTIGQELAEWRASCDYLRGLVTNMDDDDLQRPYWFPLFTGWTQASAGLGFVRSHDWSEFIQLRVHMGRTDPVPSSAITHTFLGNVLPLMLAMANREAAANRTLAVVMAFTDSGVGPWTIRVADGDITLSEGAAADADLTITQSAETFEKSRQGMHNPAEAIQSGEIRVSDFEQLAIFGQIFPS